MPHLDRTAKETGPVEINRPAETNAPDANPDKLVLPEGMERTRDATEFRNHNDSLKSQMEDGQIDKRKKERMPPQERFEGTAGNSLARPDTSLKLGNEVKQFLNKIGLKGIEYLNCFPDFSCAAVETVTIPHMTADKGENFKQAYKELSDKWNAEKREGRTDWKVSDVKKWKKDNNLVIHEKEDLKTCEFIPDCVHRHYGHIGGRYICEVKGIYSERQLKQKQKERDFYDQFDA